MKGVREDLDDCVEALFHALGTPRQVEDEAGTGRPRNPARQRRHRRVLEPGRSHQLGQPRRRSFDYLGGCLRRDVTGAETGPPRRDDESRACFYLSAQRGDDRGLLVGDHHSIDNRVVGLDQLPLGEIAGFVLARAVRHAVANGDDRSAELRVVTDLSTAFYRLDSSARSSSRSITSTGCVAQLVACASSASSSSGTSSLAGSSSTCSTGAVKSGPVGDDFAASSDASGSKDATASSPEDSSDSSATSKRWSRRVTSSNCMRSALIRSRASTSSLWRVTMRRWASSMIALACSSAPSRMRLISSPMSSFERRTYSSASRRLSAISASTCALRAVASSWALEVISSAVLRACWSSSPISSPRST